MNHRIPGYEPGALTGLSYGPTPRDTGAQPKTLPSIAASQPPGGTERGSRLGEPGRRKHRSEAGGRARSAASPGSPANEVSGTSKDERSESFGSRAGWGFLGVARSSYANRRIDRKTERRRQGSNEPRRSCSLPPLAPRACDSSARPLAGGAFTCLRTPRFARRLVRRRKAPPPGLEPGTTTLTAWCSTS